MLADNSFETTGHNRTIKITEIPKDHPNDLDELTITVNYIGQGNALKGCALDQIIIPEIMRGLNDGLRRSH